MQLRRCVPMTTRAARPSLGTIPERDASAPALSMYGAPRSPLAPRPLGGRRPGRGGRPSLCTGRRCIAGAPAVAASAAREGDATRAVCSACDGARAREWAHWSHLVMSIAAVLVAGARAWVVRTGRARDPQASGRSTRSSFAPPGRAAAAQGHFCRTSTARCWSGAQRWIGSDAQLDFRRDFARAAPRRARATIWAGLRPSTSTHGRGNAEPAVARYRPSLEKGAPSKRPSKMR